ncbi:MAG: tetratricopeptide repeat protein [Terracidiphilus sp.]
MPALRIVLWVGLVIVADSCLAQVRAQHDSRRQEALALEQQGKLPQAEAAWRAIAKTQPNNPEPYGHLGLLESHQEHYKEAVGYYRKALALKPDIPGLRLNLGLALFKGGDLKGAIPEFKILLNGAAPGSAEALRFNTLIGMSYYGLAEYADAAPYLQKAADQEPGNPALLLSLAHSYLWSKQFKNVLNVYQQILTINPDSAEADMLAGEALDEMKDDAGATKMFRLAVKANPKEPDAHFGLGYLLLSRKQLDEAATEFKAELANDPDHLQSLLYLADADIQMNQLDAARPLLERVIQIDPTVALAHLDLGIVYSERNRNEDAVRELSIAEKQMPDNVNVHWRLARLYRTMGRREEAQAEFDKASSLNKAADDDLYKKISASGARGPKGRPPALPPIGKPE